MGHIDTAIGRIVLGSSPCMTIRQEAQKAFVEAVQGFKNFTSSVDGLPEVCVIDPGTSPFILIAVWCQVTFLELDDRSVALHFNILYSPTLKLYRMCYVGSLLPSPVERPSCSNDHFARSGQKPDSAEAEFDFFTPSGFSAKKLTRFLKANAFPGLVCEVF